MRMGSGGVLRSAWFRGAAALALIARLTGCAPDSATTSSNLTETPVASALGDDPDFVVRERVLFQNPGAQKVRFEAEPFSHRGRKWHVFPMTVYPGAAIGARLDVHDDKMAGKTEVRLYG